jgi:hypothetical protein
VAADLLREAPCGDLGSKYLVASLDDSALPFVLAALPLGVLLGLPLGVYGRGAALDLQQHLGKVVLDPAPSVISPARPPATGTLDLQHQAQRPPCSALLGHADAVPLAANLDDGKNVLGTRLHPVPVGLGRLRESLDDHQRP